MQEEHEKELETLRKRVKTLQKCLSQCATWLESSYDIILDLNGGDEDDNERCLEIVAEARKLASEAV